MQPGAGPGLHYRLDPHTQEVGTCTDKNGFVVPDIGYEWVKCNKWMREYDKNAMNVAGKWVASSPYGTRPRRDRGATERLRGAGVERRRMGRAGPAGGDRLPRCQTGGELRHASFRGLQEKS